MKKRILFAGLLLLLTLSTFAATPVTSGKTNAQKIVEAIHNPKTDYVVVVSHRGRLERLPGKLDPPPLNQLSEWELMLWNWI